MQVLQGFLGQPVTPSVVGAWATATQMSARVSCGCRSASASSCTGTPANPFAGMAVGQWLQAAFPERHRELRLVDFTPGWWRERAREHHQGHGTMQPAPYGNPVGEQGNITSLDFALNTRSGFTTVARPPRALRRISPATLYANELADEFDAFGGTSPRGAVSDRAYEQHGVPGRRRDQSCREEAGNNSTSGDWRPRVLIAASSTVPAVEPHRARGRRPTAKVPVWLRVRAVVLINGVAGCCAARRLDQIPGRLQRSQQCPVQHVRAGAGTIGPMVLVLRSLRTTVAPFQ